jgi:hypothetical protein
MSDVKLCLYLISYAPYRENKQPSADTSSITNHSGTKRRCTQHHNIVAVPPSKEPLVTHWLVDRVGTRQFP